jgi:hypothetical protein
VIRRRNKEGRQLKRKEECNKVSKGVRSDQKASSKSRSMTSAPAPRLRLFGQPHLLEGEDGAAYDELFARVCAAVKPVDIIDEMFIADVVSLEWEVLRWSRLKLSLIRACSHAALEKFLREKLDFELYAEHYLEELAKLLQKKLPDDQAQHARTLVEKWARNESDAKVDAIVADIDWRTLDDMSECARAHKAEELVQEYARHEPDTVTLVDELLHDAGVSIDTFMADALAERLDFIERIDRLTSIAESRRNPCLREIERRRPVLGEALRRAVPEIENGEFKVIETPSAKGKSAT